jgi:fucose 4-O-acetylase-like acetyltransferase
LYPFHTSIKGLNSTTFSYNLVDIRDFLIGGSFPLVPWLSVFLFGYIGGRIKVRTGRYKLVASIVLLIIAALSLVIMNNTIQFSHHGHSELFYPASLLFLIFAFCLMASFWVNHTTFSNRTFYLFNVLGKSSLFVYLFHLVFILHLLPLIATLTNKNLLGSMFIFYAVTFAIVFLIDYTKKNSNWKKTPYIVRFIFGS